MVICLWRRRLAWRLRANFWRKNILTKFSRLMKNSFMKISEPTFRHDGVMRLLSGFLLSRMPFMNTKITMKKKIFLIFKYKIKSPRRGFLKSYKNPQKNRPKAILFLIWLRRYESNVRPQGYEPCELPLLYSAA